jgi:putative restriction endonuclease
MRYWWVNQTFRHEIMGGYLWSPKRNANGARNPFYESMREVAPGDLIFSFMDTRILAVGIAQSYCRESPKPLEFGKSGENWEGIGWRVKVHFTELANKVRPKDHIDILKPLLPDKYSPLQPNGNGPSISTGTQCCCNLSAAEQRLERRQSLHGQTLTERPPP